MNIHRQKKYNYKHMKNKGITKHKASQYIYVYAYEESLETAASYACCLCFFVNRRGLHPAFHAFTVAAYPSTAVNHRENWARRTENGHKEPRSASRSEHDDTAPARRCPDTNSDRSSSSSDEDNSTNIIKEQHEQQQYEEEQYLR